MNPSAILLVFAVVAPVASFVAPAFFQTRWADSEPLFVADGGNEELEAMRKMLDTSWDANTMGQVPSDAAVAAREAFSAISIASDNGVSCFFIDLLLPSYDITQGSNLYDEVLGVEYCIAVANCLKGKTSILVRDAKTLETVSRILDARERDRMKSMSVVADIEEDEDEEDEDIVDDASDEDEETVEEDGTIESIADAPTSDVDLFRQQLMSSWNEEETEEEDDSSGTPENPKANSEPKAETTTPTLPTKRYRLASMFGNARVSTGADMMQTVVEALRANALLEEDEENIIILSAITREEMVGVRSLVSKYEASKKIVLVNCKLDPVPKELFQSETVYSLLPLIARAKGSEQSASSQESPAPKIVVLRRYPKDWEVYVDVGKGFQLVQTAPADYRNKRGPPLEWVSQCVQKFLESVS